MTTQTTMTELKHWSVTGLVYSEIYLCCFCVCSTASESDLQNKRLKLDYEEITPCLKEVTVVWEKLLSTPGRTKVKFDTETIHAAVAQGTHLTSRIDAYSSAAWNYLFSPKISKHSQILT